MADQIVRLAYSYEKDNNGNEINKCNFKFDRHGSGRIVAAEDLSPTITDGIWRLDTGIRFILVSSQAKTKAQGFYFIAAPSVNYKLEARLSTAVVKVPFINVVGYTSDDDSDPYNLDNIKNKPYLQLALFPRAEAALTTSHIFPKGSVLCYLNFQVIFDLAEKESCYKLS